MIGGGPLGGPGPAWRPAGQAELAGHAAARVELKAATPGRTVTLLTAAKEIEHSHAAVLRDALAGPLR